MSNLKVGQLSAISANLGTVTAGNIYGTANISITGTANFQGITSYSGITYAAVFNTSLSSSRGITGYASGSVGFGQAVGVEGYLSSSSTYPGIAGVAARDVGTGTTSSGLYAESTYGNAVYAYSASGKALSVNGNMSINNTNLVSNLNSERWNGTQLVATVNNGSSGSLPTAYPPVALTYNLVKYLQINVGGVTGYIPVYI